MDLKYVLAPRQAVEVQFQGRTRRFRVQRIAPQGAEDVADALAALSLDMALWTVDRNTLLQARRVRMTRCTRFCGSGRRLSLTV